MNQMINTQKIDERKLIKYGTYAHTIPVPNVFISDNKINTGEKFMIYRTVINNTDVLVLVPKKNEETFNKTNGAAHLNPVINSYRENADV